MPRRNCMVTFEFILAFYFTLTLCSCRRVSSTPEFDLVISNGQVVDGSGSPPFAADLAIKGDTILRIARMDEAQKRQAGRVIDAGGQIVSPGFIDIHTHLDYPLPLDGTAQSKIRHGVTTEILGESESAGPIEGKAKRSSPYGLNVDWRSLGEYFARLQKAGISVNVGSFAGATQVRSCIKGDESRVSSREEMEKMKALVDEAMREGALGLSCALLVPSNTNAQRMSEFLAQVSQAHASEFIIMVVDGASSHKSHDLAVPDNIRLLPFPSYSPELNPQEHVWDELREKEFPNRVFDSLQAVIEQLEAGLPRMAANTQGL